MGDRWILLRGNRREAFPYQSTRRNRPEDAKGKCQRRMSVDSGPEDPGAITEALIAFRNGAPDAMDRLTPLVYEQLKRIARRHLRAEPGGHTFSTTALVHEAYLKLVDQKRAEWQDRGHFYSVA
jgi:hypothetical protein